MNPGFDNSHPMTRRTIAYECMFCHNAHPQIPSAAHRDLSANPAYGPVLPEGIDCQRCHGPGAAHVKAAQTPGISLQSRSHKCSAFPKRRRQPKKSVTLDAKSAHAHDLLGQILAQKGEVAQACTEFETALKLEPTLGPAQLDLADILMRQGQARAATALLERATHSSTADVAERAHAMLQQLRPH